MSAATYSYSLKNLVLHLEGSQERFEYSLNTEDSVKPSQRAAFRSRFNEIPRDNKNLLKLHKVFYSEGLDKVRDLIVPGSQLAHSLETYEGACEWAFRELWSLEIHYQFTAETTPETLISQSLEKMEAFTLWQIFYDITRKFELNPKLMLAR